MPDTIDLDFVDWCSGRREELGPAVPARTFMYAISHKWNIDGSHGQFNTRSFGHFYRNPFPKAFPQGFRQGLH